MLVQADGHFLRLKHNLYENPLKSNGNLRFFAGAGKYYRKNPAK